MSSGRILILGLCLLVAGGYAHAQEEPLYRPTTDAELWLSSGFELRFFKEKKKSKKERTPEQQEKDAAKQLKLERSFKYNFRVTGELGYRGNENLTSSKLVYSVLGVRYRFHKYARLTVEHRYNFRDRYSVNTSRVDIQADTDHDFGRYNVGYRLVYQHEFVVPIRYRDILRHRVQVGWRTRKFDVDPYVSMESFTALHYTGNRLIGMRYGAGAEWDITKRHGVDVSLRNDREQNLPNMQYRWIVGLAYKYTFRP